MSIKKLRVLLIIEQCNPEMPSVPNVAYQFFNEISKLVDVTLVTHERNTQALEKVRGDEEIIYIPESPVLAKYYGIVSRLTSGKGGINWPLGNALSYPIYAEFNYKVYQGFKLKVLQGDYDIVHSITPMMPRYPVAIIKACKNTPFILGPVNGGVPFPKGFGQVARKEFAYFNFLRRLGQFIPEYAKTYKKADKILVGSTFTLNMLKKMFKIEDNRIELFYENGISEEFFEASPLTRDDSQVNLLFVGRLVPYKGADIVIEAVSQLSKLIKQQIRLTIVGDGSEKDNLKRQVQELNVSDIVSFTGWVEQKETLGFYRKADIFCFPSIREFGGAVVLEAMACGLPCIVVDNGGIGEYVTSETGFKIAPISRENLTQELTNKIKILTEDEELRKNMSAKAINRAKRFVWKQKALEITGFYEKVIQEKKTRG
jgi:glycosyltransferase involved in cell wall biosynthesis